MSVVLELSERPRAACDSTDAAILLQPHQHVNSSHPHSGGWLRHCGDANVLLRNVLEFAASLVQEMMMRIGVGIKPVARRIDGYLAQQPGSSKAMEGVVDRAGCDRCSGLLGLVTQDLRGNVSVLA